jgi:serine/threonine-protein kinase
VTAPDDTQALRKYRLIAEIGRGGMADVYLAVVQGPAGFNKLVVIKKTRPELAQDPEFLAMFLDEARLAARLNHPNVVQTHEVGQDGERYFIAMEYLDGQPLNRIRARAGAAFTTAMQVRVLSDVLAGLQHAHDLCDFDGTPLGVVHRDATPQNVFVTYDGLIKVVDFGIAKAVDSSSETRTGVVKGKVTYMAPEQARGDKVDRRADVFAVGVMLWEAIAGRRMWKGVPDIAVVHELIGGKIPSIRDAVPDVDPELAAICERSLAVDRDQRFGSAQEMHDALEEYLSKAGGHNSARDVGRFVAEKFTEDRTKVKAIIESQLKDVRWSGAYPKLTGVDLPKIDPGQVMVTPTGEKVARPSQASLTPATGSLTAASSVTSLAAAPEPPPASRPNKTLVGGAVAAVVAIAVIVIGVRFLAPSSKAATPAAATTTETATATASPREPATAPAPGQDAVKLTIKVSPASAKIYLDDALLSAGPFEGKVIKSDSPRRVRAEARGYASKEETVTLSSDAILSFALEKESAAPAPAPQPRRAERAPPRPSRRPRPRRLPPTRRPRPRLPPLPLPRRAESRSAPSIRTARMPSEPMTKRSLSLAVAALLTFQSLSAFAQQGGGNEADAHFKRGVELYKESDYAAALIEFRRAYELDPRFQALYNIGETYFQLQDYANALKTLEKYLKDGGAQVSAARRDEVTKDIEKLKQRVAFVEVTTNVPDVDIAVDDVAVGKTPLAAPLTVSAGRRRITASKPGKPGVSQVLELAGGDRKKIALVVPEDGAPAKPEEPVKSTPVAPWVITGVLGAGAIVTGVLAITSSSDLKDKLAAFPAKPDDISSAHTKTFALALTTDILAGAAIVVGGISIYLTVASGSPSKSDKTDKPAAARVRWESPFSARGEGEGGVKVLAGPQGVSVKGVF